MKKTFFFGFAYLVFFFSGTRGTAQVPKLNTAFYFSSGIVVDSKGNVFVTGKNDKIIKITPEGKATLFAGGGHDNKDGMGKNAGFSYTGGIAIDVVDNMYVTDGARIRKITPDAAVSTIAGTDKAAVIDGNRETGSFLHLDNIAVDHQGTIYVTDYAPGKDWMPGQITNSGEYLIRKITPQGMVTTVKNEDNSAFRIRWVRGLACDPEDNLYVCATISHCIKKITLGGAITGVAGQCDKKEFNSVYKEGDINTAVLTTPSGIAIAKNGDIYFSDERLHRIIKISGNKVITVAGSGKISFRGNPAGAAEPGERDGKAMQALFHTPMGIAFDKAGNLYIVDGSSLNNSYIRKLSTDGTVSTFCKHFWNPKTQQYEEAD